MFCHTEEFNKAFFGAMRMLEMLPAHLFFLSLEAYFGFSLI
jgi:hypothetical protein